MSSRRQFLTHSCGLGFATLTTGTSLLSLGIARQASAHNHGQYKALVCIQLGGGNDCYNMLVPYDSDQYDEYSTMRSNLALDKDHLLPLPQNADGRTYAMHQGMQEVHDMYLDGEVAIVNNVGTLLEPVDAAAVEARSARVPVGLYSHSDQQTQWQTAVSYSRSETRGWVGRVADISTPNLANGLSMNVSLSGSNILQSGQVAVPYSINPDGDGARGIFAYGDPGGYGEFRKRMIDQVFDVEHPNLLRNEFAALMRRAIANQQTFVEAIRTAPEIQTPFDEERLSRAMRQIARVIAVRGEMGAHRQTFFVNIGGWDHHDEVLNNQDRMLPYVSRAMYQFNQALKELGVFDNVTTFTISDFARTMTSNGKGSDHGWGGHHLVMGGAVKGGQQFGTYPTIQKDNPLDTGRGVFVPTTSTEEYFAELALWFDVSPNDLDRVLPNIRSFYSPGSESPPLGFLV